MSGEPPILRGIEPRISVDGTQLQVEYQLLTDQGSVDLAGHLQAGVALQYVGPARCAHCDKQVPKLYNRSFCYECFSTLARCDLCFVSPDRCHFDAGTCREPDWAEQVCMQPHSLYLANTSGPKVGITRQGRQWRRWADQGASSAMVLATAPTRRAAGKLEAIIRQNMSDRTDWRRLVAGMGQPADLLQIHAQLTEDTDALYRAWQGPADRDELRAIEWVRQPQVYELHFPVHHYSPAQRLRVDAGNPALAANLTGIIGQYLLFDNGAFNVPEHAHTGVTLALLDTLSDSERLGDGQQSLF